MSEESLNDQLKAERQRKRRRRTSRNLEDFNEVKNAPPTTTGRVALQELPSTKTASAQVKNPSSGNSNSLELSDERKSKPRRTRKRASRRNIAENEEGEHSMERRGHRRPPKPRMNRSVSEEVLDIQREMDEAQLGIRRMPNASRKTQGTYEPAAGGHKPENDHSSTLPKSGESRRQKPKRNKAKQQRLSRLQNTSAEEENYQADLDDEASFCGGFKVDKEDIVVEETNASKVPAPIPSVNSAPLLPSQPLSVLFIERKDGGFKKENKDKLAQTEVANHETPTTTPREPTTSDFAMSTHRAFKVFALFCHGLLAGFALCQCLFVYSLSSHSDGTDNFLQNYYKLSQPISSVYYFLLAVCTVSVFDSFGMVKTKSGFCHGLLTSPAQTLSLIAYVLALIFTLSVAMFDDRISLYKVDSSFWKNETKKEDLFADWKILNLMRVLGSVLGWILLAIQPSKDSMEEGLFDNNTSAELPVASTTNHVVGCNIGQLHQRGGYKDISP